MTVKKNREIFVFDGTTGTTLHVHYFSDMSSFWLTGEVLYYNINIFPLRSFTYCDLVIVVVVAVFMRVKYMTSY